MDSSQERVQRDRAASDFATTQWSVVLSAGRRDVGAASHALATLCQRYWYPLYAFVRCRGFDCHQAQDLTQEFFAQVLEKNALASASPDRGRFRSFLLAALKNFLANEWDKTQTQKRGGGQLVLSLELDEGESRFNLEPAHELTPERLFERQWTLTLLSIAMDRLQAEFVADGKARYFELLKGALGSDQGPPDYQAMAAELGMTEDAARQAAHRLRKRYRALLREEVAQTVAEPSEVDEEIRGLFAALE